MLPVLCPVSQIHAHTHYHVTFLLCSSTEPHTLFHCGLLNWNINRQNLCIYVPVCFVISDAAMIDCYLLIMQIYGDTNYNDNKAVVECAM